MENIKEKIIEILEEAKIFYLPQLMERIADKILDLFSKQRIEFSRFDVDDIMQDWTHGDWVEADEDNREIADLINNKLKQIVNK